MNILEKFFNLNGCGGGGGGCKKEPDNNEPVQLVFYNPAWASPRRGFELGTAPCCSDWPSQIEISNIYEPDNVSGYWYLVTPKENDGLCHPAYQYEDTNLFVQWGKVLKIGNTTVEMETY